MSPADRLPSGRHNLSREYVISSQRRRVHDAMAQVCEAKGYANATVRDIVTAASISRSTFYELYDDKEACFLAACDEIQARVITNMKASVPSGLNWVERMRSGVEILLSYFSAEPASAHLCIVDLTVMDGDAGRWYREVIGKVAAHIDEGRVASPSGDLLPVSLAPAIVGGCVSLIRTEIVTNRAGRLIELLPDLEYLILAPYLGPDEALRQSR